MNSGFVKAIHTIALFVQLYSLIVIPFYAAISIVADDLLVARPRVRAISIAALGLLSGGTTLYIVAGMLRSSGISLNAPSLIATATPLLAPLAFILYLFLHVAILHTAVSFAKYLYNPGKFKLRGTEIVQGVISFVGVFFVHMLSFHA